MLSRQYLASGVCLAEDIAKQHVREFSAASTHTEGKHVNKINRICGRSSSSLSPIAFCCMLIGVKHGKPGYSASPCMCLKARTCQTPASCKQTQLGLTKFLVAFPSHSSMGTACTGDLQLIEEFKFILTAGSRKRNGMPCYGRFRGIKARACQQARPSVTFAYLLLQHTPSVHLQLVRLLSSSFAGAPSLKTPRCTV